MTTTAARIFKAEAEAFVLLSSAVPRASIMQTEDCVGNALRLHDKCKDQPEFNLQVIECKAEAKILDASSGAAAQTNIMQTGEVHERCLAGAGQGVVQAEADLALRRHVSWPSAGTAWS